MSLFLQNKGGWRGTVRTIMFPSANAADKSERTSVFRKMSVSSCKDTKTSIPENLHSRPESQHLAEEC